MAIEARLREIINEKGFISVAEMMKIALSSNPNSYYRNRNPLGIEGDFITAPEISQIFGELIGIWCADFWLKLGQPSDISIVELGPGRGLLMRDLLRATKHIPGFHDSINIELVEISEALTQLQQTELKDYSNKIKWHKKIEDIASKQTIFIANEFFDALPIRQFEKEKEIWYERILTSDPLNSILHFSRLPINDELSAQLNYEHPNAGDGAIVEESIESIEHIKFISEHLNVHGGAALIIDYGYDIPPKERTVFQYNPTLQALKHHKYQPILDTIGEADLTAHVDFYSFKQAAQARKLITHGAITQGEFLKNMGIMYRLEMLKKNVDIFDQEVLDKQVARLIDSDKMGALFKVLIISNEIEAAPAGI
ncbi:MAG: succinate dehydrogenase [ubiquinone] iron-sulfur subunit [Rickettsiaceae bacterium]|jgi:SAM-dependent MidA family methyltransferase|nr:succinate dehydrogenase [ubiquinone] iron-sulfur subunit [Rickettsiaceae bacterium]